MNQDTEDDLKPWNESEKKVSFITTLSPQADHHQGYTL